MNPISTESAEFSAEQSGRAAAATAPGLVTINPWRPKMTSSTISTAEPQVAKPPSAIGAGFVVIRRISGKRGRLRSSSMPYEHVSVDSAVEEAARLAAEHGSVFEVYARAATAYPPADSKPVEEIPVVPPQKATRGGRRLIGISTAKSARAS